MQTAKERYSKEKAAKYYLQNKEVIKEKSREHYKNLSQEEKDKIKEYQRKKYQELVQYKKEALKNNFLFFLIIKRMSKKTLKSDNIRVNKKELHKSKQPINLMSVNTEHILTSDKFKHSDEGFTYFTGYQDGIVKPLGIILPQMSGYIKYFENGGKNMSFMIKDDNVLDKYNKIRNKIKEKLSIKFHSMPVYDETYIIAKVREFYGKIKTNLLGDKIPKENMHYTCIACITIDSVIKMDKKNYPQVYSEECKYRVKKIQMSRFINTELESDSESKSVTESESKLEFDSDSE